MVEKRGPPPNSEYMKQDDYTNENKDVKIFDY